MESADDSPSIWNIHAYLLSILDFADDFASNHPDHAADVARFSLELRRLKKELMTSFESDFVQAPIHDILAGLMGARGLASFMAERHPEKSGPLTRFVEGLNHAQAEFIGKVRPEWGE